VSDYQCMISQEAEVERVAEGSSLSKDMVERRRFSTNSRLCYDLMNYGSLRKYILDF